MYIIAIGWLYVTFMMAITEKTAVAGVMTFVFYGFLPVLVIVYLGGAGVRRKRRQKAQAATAEQTVPDEKKID
jgi:biotin transporter BioY